PLLSPRSTRFPYTTLFRSSEDGLSLVRVDRMRIVHVLTNFMTNAIKHSPAGGEIIVQVRRKDQSTLRFSVLDRGPGIPVEFQSRSEEHTSELQSRFDLVCR